MSKTTIHIDEYTFFYDEKGDVLTDSKESPINADVRKISTGEFSVLIDGKSYHLFITNIRETSVATVNNFVFTIQRETMRDKLAKQLQKDSGTNSTSITLRAPMPGLITKMLKTEGATINAGEGILIVEAMKMENEIKSPKQGTIKKIFVKEKQTVEKNDNLFTIE